MSKNVIVVMDSVLSFVNGLKRYIEKETPDEVLCIDDFDDLKQLTFDYLLIEEERMKECPYKDKRLFTIISGESTSDHQVNRYNKPNLIYHQMIQTYEKTQNELTIVSIYSMAGGTGKSTLAKGLCAGLESFGIRPLHLSFSIDMQQKSAIDLSLLIYYFAESNPLPESLILAIKDTIASAQRTITCTLNRPEDSVYLTADLVRQLITWLGESFDISYMIIEVPWVFGPLLNEVLRLSHKKLLVGDQRHSGELMMDWQSLYQHAIHSKKGDYAILNRISSLSHDDDSLFYIGVLEDYTLKKGMKEWCSKYLLTHWMR